MHMHMCIYAYSIISTETANLEGLVSVIFWRFLPQHFVFWVCSAPGGLPQEAAVGIWLSQGVCPPEKGWLLLLLLSPSLCGQ